MANRKQRASIAKETVSILERGAYTVDGSRVLLADELAAMRSGTTLYTPSNLESMVAALKRPTQFSTKIDVVNCTTFFAAESLIREGDLNPLCLNFASAKNPGGGFLSGSQAQEECLARASGLHQSLSSQMAYYEVNRSNSSSLYTNHLIYSPRVPVFRNDDDALLATPFKVSIVTSPAVNSGAVQKNEPESVPKIRPTMQHRINSVLAVARKYEHKSLVLGAWGCGVFGNNPDDVAKWFADALQSDERFINAFERVVFAVLDFSEGTPTYHAFRNVFR